MDFFARHKFVFPPLAAITALILVELLWSYDIFERRLALVLTAVLSMVVYLTVYFILEKKFKIALPAFTTWIIFLAVLLDAMGNFLHYYGTLGWWDDFTHFVGTVAAAILVLTILHLLSANKVIKIGKFAMALFTVSVSMLLATFYEITEYWGDLVFKIHRIGERYDTVSDLNWNFFGALLVTILGLVFFRKRKNR